MGQQTPGPMLRGCNGLKLQFPCRVLDVAWEAVHLAERKQAHSLHQLFPLHTFKHVFLLQGPGRGVGGSPLGKETASPHLPGHFQDPHGVQAQDDRG